jgi:DNA-directed RNA polymerase subunit RPC12/RpoP
MDEEKVRSSKETALHNALLISSQEPTPAALGENEWRCENLPNSGKPKFQETADKPLLGTIKLASEIGYKGHSNYIFVSCKECGEERWVRLQDYRNGKGIVCRACGYKSTMKYTRKVENLRALGAKRASELGKPVGKKDPWYYPHACSYCGELTWHMKKDLNRVCGKCAYKIRKVKSGLDHPNWNGGRYVSGGYAVIKVEPSDPYYPMTHATGYMLEHRYVAAKNLGRLLEDYEIVHHIDGNKLNNVPDNLEVLPHNADHLPYIMLQKQVYALQEKVEMQDKEIKLLKWHISKMEQGNPELADSVWGRASVETIQEVSSNLDKERVQFYEKS